MTEEKQPERVRVSCEKGESTVRWIEVTCPKCRAQMKFQNYSPAVANLVKKAIEFTVDNHPAGVQILEAVVNAINQNNMAIAHVTKKRPFDVECHCGIVLEVGESLVSLVTKMPPNLPPFPRNKR